MNPSDIPGHIPHPMDPSLDAQQAQVADASSSSDDSNSELNRVAQDIGATINKWERYLTQALDQWSEDLGDMTELIDQVKSVMGEFHAMIVAYQNYPNGVDFSKTQYDRIVSAMVDLGIPESQIQGGNLGSDGYYHFTGTQYLNDLKMMGQYIVQDFPSLEAQLSGYKQDETKDLMAVMYCTNSIKMNEESLSGLLSTLTSLSQSLLQEVPD